MTGISFFLSRRVYFRIKRMYFLVCLFLLRTTSSSIWLTWVFPIIGPNSWHFAPISPRESRGDSSPSISWFVTTPNGDFPLTFLPRKACASVPQGETTDVTACNQRPTHFPRLILWAQEVRWPTSRPTAWMVDPRALWPLIWEASGHFLQDGATVLLGLQWEIQRRSTMEIKGWQERTWEQRLQGPGIILPGEEKLEVEGCRRGQDGRGASTSSTWPAVQHSE